jgi:hypothetical protein
MMRKLAFAGLLLLAGCHSGPSPQLREAMYYCDVGDRRACTAVSVLRSTEALNDAENTFALLSIGAMGFGAYASTLPGHAVNLAPWWYRWWW